MEMHLAYCMARFCTFTSVTRENDVLAGPNVDRAEVGDRD
jgi:hypothetical protein